MVNQLRAVKERTISITLILVVFDNNLKPVDFSVLDAELRVYHILIYLKFSNLLPQKGVFTLKIKAGFIFPGNPVTVTDLFSINTNPAFVRNLLSSNLDFGLPNSVGNVSVFVDKLGICHPFGRVGQQMRYTFHDLTIFSGITGVQINNRSANLELTEPLELCFMH